MMKPEPPGPKGLPFVGNSLRYARDPFEFLSACGQAYETSDVVRVQFGRRPTFLLLDPDDIRTVLAENETYPKAEFEGEAFRRLFGNGLLTSEGEFWRQQRQLVQPAFRGEQLASSADVMTGHAESLIDRWSPGETRDIHSEMSRLAVRIIAGAMFGARLDEATLRVVQEAIQPVGQRFEPAARRVFLPDWLPTPERRRYEQSVQTLERILDDIVTRRQESGSDGGDLLSILLAAQQSGQLSDEQVRDELMTILLAGHDTTALALTYTWYLLGTHPEVEEELVDELSSVLGGRMPTMADVPKLEHTERVLKEVMRLYPPAYLLFRTSLEDVSFGGYDVSEGSTLMLSQWVTHRSGRHYENPDTFDPDRWLPERASDRHPYAYFPFGGGPRHCIGKRFAMLEATLVLATIAQEHRLELVDDSPLDLMGSITMHPRNPVEVVIRER